MQGGQSDSGAGLRQTLVQRVKAAEHVAQQAAQQDRATEPATFTETFASGLTLEQEAAGGVVPQESAAKQLLRFRSAQKAQEGDAPAFAAASSAQRVEKITSPLLQQIAESGIDAEQQKTSGKGGSRKGNVRLKVQRSKGEGYSDRMQERLAGKSHRKDRIARMKRVY